MPIDLRIWLTPTALPGRTTPSSASWPSFRFENPNSSTACASCPAKRCRWTTAKARSPACQAPTLPQAPLFVATLRYSPPQLPPRGLELRPASLGRGYMNRPSGVLRWVMPLRGTRQPQGGRAQARPVRARAQPRVRCHPGALRGRGRPSPRARPQPQGQRRARHWPYPGHGLEGQRSRTIEEQNAHLEHWETKWAASRIHGAERRQVQAMFEEERPHLQALTAHCPWPTSAKNAHAYHRRLRRVSITAAMPPGQPALAARYSYRLFRRRIEILNPDSKALIRTHSAPSNQER